MIILISHFSDGSDSDHCFEKLTSSDSSCRAHSHTMRDKICTTFHLSCYDCCWNIASVPLAAFVFSVIHHNHALSCCWCCGYVCQVNFLITSLGSFKFVSEIIQRREISESRQMGFVSFLPRELWSRGVCCRHVTLSVASSTMYFK